MTKRAFDLFFASAGLVVLAPLFAAIAVWVKLDSPGPVFFRQVRVGQFGRTFRIHKFRTMKIAPADVPGLQLTVGADDRITRSGEFLRRYKLDELAQLIDVVIGDMSLVGPRPEVPKYVAYYPIERRDLVLSVRPGITDLASLQFKDENEILGRTISPERAYIEEILPKKLDYYVHYAQEHTLWGDTMIIVRTLNELFVPCHRHKG